MKTKALLLTVALGAASAATSMAQVYSQNAVGYINIACKHGFNLIADQLITADRTIQALFPNAPDQLTVYRFNPGSGFNIIVNDISGIGGWEDPSVTVPLGGGVFVYNPLPGDYNVTFVGEVPQGTLTTPIVHGFQIISSQVPQSGHIQNVLGLNPVDQDQVYKYNNPGGYQIITYDLSGLGDWDDVPTVNVGDAVFFYAPSVTHSSWTRTFTVN